MIFCHALSLYLPIHLVMYLPTNESKNRFEFIVKSIVYHWLFYSIDLVTLSTISYPSRNFSTVWMFKYNVNDGARHDKCSLQYSVFLVIINIEFRHGLRLALMVLVSVQEPYKSDKKYRAHMVSNITVENKQKTQTKKKKPLLSLDVCRYRNWDTYRLVYVPTTYFWNSKQDNFSQWIYIAFEPYLLIVIIWITLKPIEYFTIKVFQNIELKHSCIN